jgi:uncharacterized protein YcnI
MSVAVALAAVVATAGPAAAHVTVGADDATRGAADSVLTFRVPNEDDAAKTVKVQITFPTKNPIASVKPETVPGWTATTTSVTFNPPIKTDDGDIKEGVGSITYTATAGGIAVGQFVSFRVLVGPLPDTKSLVFPTVQTYSNGKSVSWIEPIVDPATMPEHPAPVLELTAAAAAADSSPSAVAPSSSTAASPSSAAATPSVAVAAAPTDPASYATRDDVSTGRTMGLLGMVAGLLGLGLGGASFARRRPRNG